MFTSGMDFSLGENVDALREMVGRKDAAGCILNAAEKATQVALDAIQRLGSHGYINELPTARLLRTSEIRRMLIGRGIFAQTA
jgi:isovaleryl-CoA dehydrogenase